MRTSEATKKFMRELENVSDEEATNGGWQRDCESIGRHEKKLKENKT